MELVLLKMLFITAFFLQEAWFSMIISDPDPDPTGQVISDPDLDVTGQVITNPNPDPNR